MSFIPSPNDLGKDSANAGSMGINMQLLIGPFFVRPAPEGLIQSIKSVQVTNTDSGRDGFQITFAAGRSAQDADDYSILKSDLLKPFTRVVIIVRIGVWQRILIDGFITRHQISLSESPGKSTFTVTGEDYSILMDMNDNPRVLIGLPDYLIVNEIILRNGLVPNVVPPPQVNWPNPVLWDPSQTGTDLECILELARKYHYIFYIEPTDIVGVNVAHWEPPIRAGIPQKALTVGMGTASNARDISFEYNALQPVMVFGAVQDQLAQNVPVPVIVPLPLPPYLSSEPAHIFNMPHVRKKLYMSKGSASILESYIQAIAEVDASKDVVSATGKVDTLRYGDILKARRLVSLRGVGKTNDGIYYVKSVTHDISPGSYGQSFTLTREGTGSIISGVN